MTNNYNNQYKLTKYVNAAGWAAKIGPADLTNILSCLKSTNKNLLVGIDSSDDATVFKINESTSIVQTVDIITPVVDDPYIFGQIAAANSLSDIFAMGGDVLTAMNIVGFDKKNQPYKVLEEILKGGLIKLKECGGIIAGGHTIETPEMLYGLSVTGTINPNNIYRNNTLRKDDVLILTKPLGMGILTTALKNDLLDNININNIINILSQLNYRASKIMKEYDVSACTDITGFGLAGHAYEMCNDKFTIEFDFNSLPKLDIVDDFIKRDIIPGGSLRNKEYLIDKVQMINNYETNMLFFDAQTSGGLLMAVSQKDAPKLLEKLKSSSYEYSTVVGIVKQKEEKALVLK